MDNSLPLKKICLFESKENEAKEEVDTDEESNK